MFLKIKIGIVAVICLTHMNHVCCQNTFYSLELTLLEDTIPKISPIFYEVKISQNAISTETVTFDWNSKVKPMLKLKISPHSEWKNLKHSNISYSYLYDPSTAIKNCYSPLLQTINPKSLKEQFAYLAFQKEENKYQYHLEKEGTYFIKAVCYYTVNSGIVDSIESKEQMLTVFSSKDDEPAYKWLKTLSTPHFMYDKLIKHEYWPFYNEIELKEVENLTKKFPKSSYAKWSRLQIAFHYLNLGYNEKNGSKKEKYMLRANGLIEQSIPFVSLNSFFKKELIDAINDLANLKLEYYMDFDEYAKDIDIVKELLEEN